MKEKLIAAWEHNVKSGMMLLDDVCELQALHIKPAGGGRSAGAQFTHISNVRGMWHKALIDNGKSDAARIDKEDSENREVLKIRFQESALLIPEIIESSWDNDFNVSGFKHGLFSFMTYLVSHEAHHRGQIIFTLKASGIRIGKDKLFALWNWNKF